MKKLNNYNKYFRQQYPYARTILENEKKMTLKEAGLKSLEGTGRKAQEILIEFISIWMD